MLPSVRNNLTDLRRALTDADTWGLPANHIVEFPDETDPQAIIDALRAAAIATKPDGLLLYYYAGHGLINAGDLMLSLPGTDPRHPDEKTLAYAKLREATGESGTERRLIIIDCCLVRCPLAFTGWVPVALWILVHRGERATPHPGVGRASAGQQTLSWPSGVGGGVGHAVRGWHRVGVVRLDGA